MANGIFTGTAGLNDLKLGSSQVDKVYQGTNEVWSSGPAEGWTQSNPDPASPAFDLYARNSTTKLVATIETTTYTFAGYQRSLGATGSPNVRIILKNATGGNGQASVFSDADAWTAFSVDFTPSTSEVLYVGMEADNIFFGSQVTQRWRYVTVTKV